MEQRSTCSEQSPRLLALLQSPCLARATFGNELNPSQRLLEEENTLRESIRDCVRVLESDVRALVAALAAAHITPEPEFPALAATAREHLPAVQKDIASLAALIPKGSYFRYHGSFNITMQQAAFAIAFIGWLEADRLVTLEEVTMTLGIDPGWSDHFLFTQEDYLHALITLINELARLSPNSVTLAAQRDLPLNVPLRISRFSKDLSAGFSLLNLKNDSLRRRFDSIKYDVKTIEQIMYDCTLRRLIAPDTGNKRPRVESLPAIKPE